MTGSTLWPQAALAALAAAAGFGVGWLHFASLRRVARLLAAGRLAAVGLQLARLALLAAFLVGCARIGAAELFAAAAGLVGARIAVVRRSG